MLKFLLTALLSFFFLISRPQTVEISGSIPGAENQEVRLLAYDDFISGKRLVLDRVIVDSAGNFVLRTEAVATRQVLIDLDFYQAYFYIQPGNDYRLQCDSVNITGQFRPFYLKDPLEFVILDEPPPQLNKIIDEFEQRYARFVDQEYGGIYQRRNIKPIQVFREEWNTIYPHDSIPYIKDYVDYRLGHLSLTIAPVKQVSLIRELVYGRPVLLDNPEYMLFFVDIFRDYLVRNNKFISRYDLEETVNREANVAALIDSVGKDTLLRNEVIRELVILVTLKTLFTDPGFDAQNVISMLTQLINRSKFTHHRAIATNLIQELTALKPGTTAPRFQLENLDGGITGLQDLVGKPVYLSFQTTWSFACLAEYVRYDSLYREFGDRIQFVTVSLDKSKDIVEKFRKEYNYNWLFLYNGSGYDILNQYQVKTFPLFVLIDDTGRIADYPAYKPSEVIEERFLQLLQHE